MSFYNMKAAYEKIKSRYMRSSGHVGHHGDCHIYRADYPHCSCGLIHDLNWIRHPEAVYDKFVKDHVISEGGTWKEDHEFTEEEKKKSAEEMKLLEGLFGKPEPEDPHEFDADIALIKSVFGYCHGVKPGSYYGIPAFDPGDDAMKKEL